MKKILIFIFLASKAWANPCACGDANLIDCYGLQNTGNATCNGNNLTVNGTVPYNSSTLCNGQQYMAGTFSTANYYAAPAAIYDGIEGITYTVVFDIYLFQAPNLSNIMRWDNVGDSEVTEFVFTSVSTDPANMAFRHFSGGFLSVATGTVISVGVCYNIRGQFNGASSKIFVDGVLKNTGNMGTESADLDRLRIGTEGTVGFADGYISNLAFYNAVVEASPTPTISPSPTVSPTPTVSSSPTATPSSTPTWTPTATPSETRTATPSATPSATPTATRTITPLPLVNKLRLNHLLRLTQ